MQDASLSIHLTDLCNSACSFCVVGSPFYTKNHIEYQDVVDFLQENSVNDFYSIVNLHGGEPTVHPRFIETLKLIKELGYIEVHLQTNAIKLADLSFAENCMDLNVTKFIVSLHGSTESIQDDLTATPNGAHKTFTALKNLQSLKANVRTNTVITIDNYKDLKNIAKMAVDRGVNHLNFSAMHPVGSARISRGRLMPKLTSVIKELETAINIVNKAGRRITIEGFPHCIGIESGFSQYQLQSEYRDIKMLIRGVTLSSYDDFMRNDMRVFGVPCEGCGERKNCGGVYPEYVDYFGWEELNSIDEIPAMVVQ